MANLHPGTDFRSFSFLQMETSEQYREYAEECERLAKLLKREDHRKVLEQMAKEWRRLADKGD